MIPSNVGSASQKKGDLISLKLTSLQESKKLHKNLIPHSSLCIKNNFEEDSEIKQDNFQLPIIAVDRPKSKIKSKHKKNSNLEGYSPLK